MGKLRNLSFFNHGRPFIAARLRIVRYTSFRQSLATAHTPGTGEAAAGIAEASCLLSCILVQYSTLQRAPAPVALTVGSYWGERPKSYTGGPEST